MEEEQKKFTKDQLEYIVFSAVMAGLIQHERIRKGEFTTLDIAMGTLKPEVWELLEVFWKIGEPL